MKGKLKLEGADRFGVIMIIDPKLKGAAEKPLFAKKHEAAKKMLANLQPKQ